MSMQPRQSPLAKMAQKLGIVSVSGRDMNVLAGIFLVPDYMVTRAVRNAGDPDSRRMPPTKADE